MKTSDIIVWLVLLVLAACTHGDAARVNRSGRTTRAEVRGSRTRKSDDTHEEIVPTRNESQVVVQLRTYDSPREVVHACLQMGAWPGWTESQVLRAHPAPGCSAFTPSTSTCVIHTLSPRYVEDGDRMENAGHELLHYFRGAYHTQE